MVLKIMLTESIAYWCAQLSEKASATYRFTNSDDFKQKYLELIAEVSGSGGVLTTHKNGQVDGRLVLPVKDRPAGFLMLTNFELIFKGAKPSQ